MSNKFTRLDRKRIKSMLAAVQRMNILKQNICIFTGQTIFLTRRQCGCGHLFGHDSCSSIVNLAQNHGLGQNKCQTKCNHVSS